MGNPFKKTTNAVTSKGNPFRKSTSETAIADSALSPLLEETPFTVARPSLPSGPRASKPLPVMTTTAKAPRELEQRLTRAIMEGTKKTAPFGSEEELTPEQVMQRERARGAVAVAEDIGRSVAGQPARSVYRMATGIANIRNDPRAAALAESLRKIEEETAPQTAFGQVNIPLPNFVGGGELPINLLRTGSEIGSFALSGLLTGAARSGLESAAGKEFSTVGRRIENPLLRGLADASLDLLIPGALAARRGYKAVANAGDVTADAFMAGLREGAGEAVESATPQLARRGEGPYREVPVREATVDPSAILAKAAQQAREAETATSGINVVPALSPRTTRQQNKLRRQMAESRQQVQADIDDRRAMAMPDMEATGQLEAAAEAGRQQRAAQPQSPITLDQRFASAATPGIVGAGVGGATGEEDSQLTPVQRAILFGTAGVVGGGYAGRRFLRGKAPSVPRGSTPALQFVNEGISVGARGPANADRLLSRFERFRTRVFSETLPLERAAKIGGGEAARKNVSEMIAQQHGAGQSAKQYLRDRITPVIEGLSDTELDDARALLKSRRLLNIVEKGGSAKGEGTPDIWRQAIADGDANPRVKAAADEVNAIHRDLLEMRYKAGLLTEDEYQKILGSDDFYTPFVKSVAEDMTSTPNLTLPDAKVGGFNVFSKGVKRMDRNVQTLANTADPFEMTTLSVSRTLRDVRKQEVVNSLMELADAGALPFVRQVKGDPTKPLAANQFKQIRNGKTRIYSVDDPDMLRAIAGRDAQTDYFGKALLKGMKAIKTAGITLSPAFAVKNVIRDVPMAAIQRPDFARGLKEAAIGSGIGGVGGAALGEDRDLEGMVANFAKGAGIGAGAGWAAKPLAQTLKAVGDITLGDKDLFRRFFNDEDYKAFLRQGGSTEGFYVRSPEDAQKVLNELRNQKVDLRTIVNPRSWVDALRFIGSVGEQSTRLAAYRQSIKAGKTPLEAIVDAQDRTLRFSNVGSGTKQIAEVVPFWNTKAQGWDKLARMLKNPKTYAAGITAITAPTIALWFSNKDNPNYWGRPQWERDLFWLVPIPDSKEFFRVPKPFEIGYLFGSSFERVLDYAAHRGAIESAAQQTAEPERALARSAASMVTGSLEGTLPSPPIVDIPLQIAANYDLFRGRNISQRPDLPTELQGGRNVSALGRILSQYGVSPEKVDFAVRELFGTAGEEGLKLSTAAARAAGADIPESDQPPAITGMFERAFVTQDRGQTEQEVAARERLARLATIQAGYNELKKRGDREATIAYAQKHLDDLDLYKELRPLQRYIDDQTARRRQVERSTKYSKEDREALISLYRDRISEASNAIIGKKLEAP
jgi:hypothetical protein